MRKPMALAVLLLLSPGLAWAQTGPEHVLPPKSQLFFRWDGAKAHRAEFDATALGKTMKGDAGKFLAELWTYAKENIEQAIDQADPQAGGIFKEVTKTLAGIAQGGVALGVEVDRFNPPKVNAVFVFPDAAGDQGTLFALIKQATEAARLEVKETKVGRRPVYRVDFDEAPGLVLGWWQEGNDAVVTIGTQDPVEYARDVDGKKTGLAKHPLYQKLQGFKEYTTGSRGFIDLQGILKVVEDVSPEASKLVDALGVKGLKNITFVSGYDGPAFRSAVEVDIPGPRKGLLALTSNRKFTLRDLPPLPSDITGFSAASTEIGKAYDVLLPIVESGIRIFAPDQVENIQAYIKAVEGKVGVNFRDDIFACFGDLTVSYASPAEGILGLGSTTLVQVKDGAKLVRSIDTLVKNIPYPPGFEVDLTKKKYRDAEIMDVYFKINQFSSRIGSFAVYKDWFIFSQYPQGIKGFVLRSNGELPTWKANAELTKILEPFPKEFVGIDVSDPRRGIGVALATAPIVIDLLNRLTAFVPNLRPFEIDLIPHAEEATRQLFPRVTVTTDDGKRIRSVSRSSLGLP
jgi:hypothetical protein